MEKICLTKIDDEVTITKEPNCELIVGCNLKHLDTEMKEHIRQIVLIILDKIMGKEIGAK